MQPQAFIDLIAPHAQEAARRYPGTYASVCIAQAALESGWGRSDLARKTRNYLGVKWHGDPRGPFPEHVTGVYLHRTTERPDSGEYVTDAYFRTYADARGSALDWADNLKSKKVYADAGAWTATDASGFILAIGKPYTGGDSSYAPKVLDIMQRYNLRDYDKKEAPMATPLTADQALAALKAEGLRVVEIPGWKTHNRNHKGAWGPVNGVMVHYTASKPARDKEAAYAKNILFDGYAGLPGPLCQFGVGTDGTVYMTGWGRCNHAGLINRAMLDKVINGTMSLDKTEYPGGDEIDGNSRLYGIENIASGEINAAQYDASVKICAALCKAHGWDGRDVMSHGEGTRRKTNDPPKTNMGHFRRAVMARVAGAVEQDEPATTKAINTAPTGDPVPDLHEQLPINVQINKGGDWALARPEIFSPYPVPTRFQITAYINGSEGTTIQARVVEWRGDGWHRNPPVTIHPTPGKPTEGQISHTGWTHRGGLNVHLDVSADKPDRVEVRPSTLVWPIG